MMAKNDWNSDSMMSGRDEAGSTTRETGPTRQLDPGTYEVTTSGSGGGTYVGMVFVEGSAEQMVLEHWVLSQVHKSPTVHEGFSVREIEGPGFSSLAAFFQAMQQQAQNWSKVTYIKATCEYYSYIPNL